MVGGVLYVVAALIGLVVGIIGVRFVLEPANTLGLDIFRPYRGDPWPHGVQEEDVARFNLSAARSRHDPIRPEWSDIVIGPADGWMPGDVESGDASLEEVYGESVTVEPLRAVVHRAPH